MKIIYVPDNYDGHHILAFADGECEEFLLRKVGSLFYTTTENIIQAAKTLVAEGKITEQVVIVYEGVEYPINQFGATPNYHIDHSGDWAERRLKAAFRKKNFQRLDKE